MDVLVAIVAAVVIAMLTRAVFSTTWSRLSMADDVQLPVKDRLLNTWPGDPRYTPRQAIITGLVGAGFVAAYRFINTDNWWLVALWGGGILAAGAVIYAALLATGAAWRGAVRLGFTVPTLVIAILLLLILLSL